MSANVVLSLELALLKEKQNNNNDAVDNVLNRELTEQIQGKIVLFFYLYINYSNVSNSVKYSHAPFFWNIRRYCMTFRDKSYLMGSFADIYMKA